MAQPLPILYSFRRCPYAMRARLGLHYSNVTVELREIILREKPPEMLSASRKGTVPVLVFPDGRILDESIDILRWSLSISDPDQWLPKDAVLLDQMNKLIELNDDEFKVHLDHYKYADRFPQASPEEYRSRGEKFISQLDERLAHAEWLFGVNMTLADIAIFPFVRQFAHVDRDWFYQTDYRNLQKWLDCLLNSTMFKSCMKKIAPWKLGDTMTIFPDLAKNISPV